MQKSSYIVFQITYIPRHMVHDVHEKKEGKTTEAKKRKTRTSTTKYDTA